jgi:NADH:ubiquinone oxidoreductase subunit E
LEDGKLQNEFLQSKKSEFAELKEYIDSVKNSQGVTMQILQKAQSLFGYLPLEVQQFISDETNIPLADIYGVVTFYTQFSTEEKGKHKIGLCLGTACYVKGSQGILDKISDELMRENKFAVGNIDAVIIAQKPKFSPFIDEMRHNIASDLSTDISNINIKATTTENLGFTGRGEGIGAECICLLETKEK